MKVAIKGLRMLSSVSSGRIEDVDLKRLKNWMNQDHSKCVDESCSLLAFCFSISALASVLN